MISKYAAVFLALTWLPAGAALAADAPPGASSCSGLDHWMTSAQKTCAELLTMQLDLRWRMASQ